LSEQNLKDLHRQLHVVPTKAVEVNADSRQFPEDWLFRWRWSKGKKQAKGKKKKEEEEGSGDDLKPAGKDFLALVSRYYSLQVKGDTEIDVQPDGTPATIDFVEVGGRTTALVRELQKMPEGVEIKPKITKGGKGASAKKPKGSGSVRPPPLFHHSHVR
jgi:formamidopyrimidine-DNA glycosylase